MAMFDILAQSFPPKTKFTAEDVPDLSGKVIVVTGGNSGVGKETVRVLLNHGAKVYMASRSQEKAESAIVDLKQLTGKEAIFLKLDLGDLKSVKVAAEELQSKEPQLHVLFNNGGVMMPPVEDRTIDGYDLQFGTNVLGPFYFTKLVLPALLAGAQSIHGARVVNTSSGMHLMNQLHFKDILDENKRKKAGTQALYSQ
ncbi:hypothetical protein MIND_00355200 [Mycena indigotica]|uniref:NAD(P)-binding protein n=1 Tax=Mycena indigotica TaxID=2126181 RepID=A0A8H6T2L2_9AGAR|nr:uncharacterized protein MIND_00355200 [Mycena indigotica]KAF7309833.1 hypothetical protein MIND_00355200 [Mycena indigotica]